MEWRPLSLLLAIVVSGSSARILADCHSGSSPCRVLYLTYTAGFRHDCIPVSKEILQAAAARSGLLEIIPSEDLSLISADALRSFDAVFFYTSGELPITDQQKNDLLSFVRNGGGFGGVHSATDTLYSWPEYGDLIGAYFDGHPWVQQVDIDVEDPTHPAMRDLAPSFRIFDEIYQVRNISRERTRVLMTLDTSSVDLSAEGVHRSDGDFALAWSHTYGQGRVFYTALGHFESTWRDSRFDRLLVNALLWLTGQVDGDAAPRRAAPVVSDGGVADALVPARGLAPGSYISIYGQNLTTGSTFAATGTSFPLKLVGSTVLVNGAPIPVLYASPGQVNAQLPAQLQLGPGTPATLQVWSGGQGSTVLQIP